ncbi:MAG: SRPBCC family protein [Pseudomonadota bacterium]
MKRLIAAATICVGLASAAVFAGTTSGTATPPTLTYSDRYLTNTVTVTFDAPVSDVRAFMAANPLTNFLEPSGRIPKITDITVYEGVWGEPGAERRVDLEGGSSVLERVISNTDDAFTYQIWNITTPAGRFIDYIYGEILLSETAEGTELTWNYNIKPSVFFARPAIRSYLTEDFSPFMENGMRGFAAAYSAQNS